MGTLTKSPQEKELERLKRAKDPGPIMLQREGQDVVVNVFRRTPSQTVYHATWVDPKTNRRVVGQATAAEVYEALERRVRV